MAERNRVEQTSTAPPWGPYDPAWLVVLAREQEPDLVPALQECTLARWESAAYLAFVDAAAPNHPEAEWQFEINVSLYSRSEGELVLDMLKDGRVGGIEFTNRIRSGRY